MAEVAYWSTDSEFPVSSINSTLFCAFADLNPTNQTRFSSFTSTSDPETQTSISYIFYGLDLDWEYPSTPTEMNNLGSLLNEWRTAALNNESTVTGNTRLFLSAALFHNSNYFTMLYPIQAIRNSLDWINVMAYDF
ncbi:hypothetical protein GQ457_05G027070 [Hibiscus cannabinus]